MFGEGDWHLNFQAGLSHQYPSTRCDNLRCLEGVTIIAKFRLTKVHHDIIKESLIVTIMTLRPKIGDFDFDFESTLAFC